MSKVRDRVEKGAVEKKMCVRHHRWSLIAGAAVLLVYAAILAIMPKHVFWSPDEGGKFIQLHSIQWHGGFTYAVPYAGQRIDPTRKFFPHVSDPTDSCPYPVTTAQGAVEFHWPIWFPLLSRFMLGAFGMTGIYVIPLLSGWLIALVSGYITHSFAPRLAPFAILLVGFATPVCFYSQCFWEHTLVTLLGLLAVLILLAARPGSPGALVSTVPPLLASVMLRIEMVAFAAAVFVVWGLSGLVAGKNFALQADGATAASLFGYRSRRLRRWALYPLVVCLTAGALYVFTSTAPSRHRRFITTLPAELGITVRNVVHLPRSVVSVLVNSGHDEGPVMNPAWVTLACVAVAGCFVAAFVTSVKTEAAIVIPALFVLLAYSTSVLFLKQPYRSLHGVFPVAPFTVIGLYALPVAWRRHDSGVLTLAGIAVLYMIIGCAAIFVFDVDAEGGLLSALEWGQRYLLTLYPILTILALVALDAYWRSARPAQLKATFTVLVSAMMLIGVQQEVRGIAMLRFSRSELAVWDRVLRSDGPIVTDIWWLPTALAPLFLANEMYFVDGPTELAEWVPLAAAHGISSFTFASAGPVDDRRLANAAVRAALQDARVLFGFHFTRFDLTVPPATP